MTTAKVRDLRKFNLEFPPISLSCGGNFNIKPEISSRKMLGRAAPQETLLAWKLRNLSAVFPLLAAVRARKDSFIKFRVFELFCELARVVVGSIENLIRDEEEKPRDSLNLIEVVDSNFLWFRKKPRSKFHLLAPPRASQFPTRIF